MVSDVEGGSDPSLRGGPDARDDRALLSAHVAGDPTAFGALFARHRDRLYAVALRTAGDPEVAADALQEGLIAAFRRADSFRGDAAVTTWLHRIVVNATLDLHRRNAVRVTQPLHEPDACGSARPAEGWPRASPVDPADAVVADEVRERVLHALRLLPSEQRAALVLVDMEGWPVAEAAEVLECPVGTVKSRCARGRSRLVALLAPEADEPTRPQGPGNHSTPSSVTSEVTLTRFDDEAEKMVPRET